MGKLGVARGAGAVGVALAALLSAAPLAGQGIPRTFAHDLRDAGHDLLRVFASPAHTDADDLPAIGAAVGGSLLFYAADRPIQDWVREHQGSLVVRAVKPFREGSPLLQLGAANMLMIISAAMYFPGLLLEERSLREAGLGCAVAVEAGSLARHVIYATVSRARPSVTDDPADWALGGGDWDHHAFWGGHGANIMTCSTFLASRFRLGVGEPLLYAAAAGVALARVADLRHWPSDTFVGLVFGYAVGRLEAKRVRERHEAGEPRAASSVLPVGALERAPEGLWLMRSPAGGVIVGVGKRF